VRAIHMAVDGRRCPATRSGALRRVAARRLGDAAQPAAADRSRRRLRAGLISEDARQIAGLERQNREPPAGRTSRPSVSALHGAPPHAAGRAEALASEGPAITVPGGGRDTRSDGLMHHSGTGSSTALRYTQRRLRDSRPQAHPLVNQRRLRRWALLPPTRDDSSRRVSSEPDEPA
jgi:hypothetical protein